MAIPQEHKVELRTALVDALNRKYNGIDQDLLNALLKVSVDVTNHQILMSRKSSSESDAAVKAAVTASAGMEDGIISFRFGTHLPSVNVISHTDLSAAEIMEHANTLASRYVQTAKAIVRELGTKYEVAEDGKGVMVNREHLENKLAPLMAANDAERVAILRKVGLGGGRISTTLGTVKRATGDRLFAVTPQYTAVTSMSAAEALGQTWPVRLGGGFLTRE